MANAKPILRALDLFCGCGGIAAGFAMSRGPRGERFECVGAVDHWQAACATFTQNIGVAATCAGIDRSVVGEILDRVGGVDVITGGPPCQGFSTSGKRALDDPRNELAKAYLDAIEFAKPQAFLMENVSGFTTFQGGRLLEEVFDRARALGFEVRAGIVLASRHGVPQRRRRFIMVGVRGAAFRFPGTEPAGERGMLFDEAGGLQVDERQDTDVAPWSFDDATSDLATIEAGERLEEYRCAPMNDFQKWARSGCMSPTDHVAVSHGADFVRMMSYIPQGRSAMDPEINRKIPSAIRPQSGFPNSYARIRSDQPSPTITRNFTTPSSANCIHPHIDRALSIREGARCQSFPDSFHFSGSLTDRRLQIGNAVPPLLAKSLGDALLETLSSVRSPRQSRRTQAV